MTGVQTCALPISLLMDEKIWNPTLVEVASFNLVMVMSISICSLSDLGVSSNLIGLLFWSN